MYQLNSIFFSCFILGVRIGSFRYGLVVRIAGSHPAGPGSIPGNGKYILSTPQVKKKHIIVCMYIFTNTPNPKKEKKKNRELDIWKFLLFSQGDTQPAWPNG